MNMVGIFSLVPPHSIYRYLEHVLALKPMILSLTQPDYAPKMNALYAGLLQLDTI